MSRPSRSFEQSHLAGDAERQRNSIARRTTRGIILILLGLLGVFCLIAFIQEKVRNYQCDQACIATGIRDSGFSKPDPNKFMTRFCVCTEHLLLDLVYEERARRLHDEPATDLPVEPR